MAYIRASGHCIILSLSYINVVLDPVGCHHGLHTGFWLLYPAVTSCFPPSAHRVCGVH